MERLEKAFSEYQRVMQAQNFIKEELDYSILDKHIAMLNELDKIESGAYAIFDLSRLEHIYLSPKYESVFKMDIEQAQEEGNRFFDSRIHPDDFIDGMEAGTYFMDMILKIPPDERKNFKFIADYRMLDNDGKYRRVIEQQMALELDSYGNLWLALSVLDFSPESNLNAPYNCRALNFHTGEWYYLPVKSDIALSKREKEILGLIARGNISKQIADQLFISVNTVNTHRQRIIDKLGVSNTTEAISYASELGILN
jgi:DNA-binding CsgD family transcriptional regulator